MNYELIKQNEGLIYKMMSKFQGLDKDDLYQVGAIGIMKAYANYVDSYDAKFSTYACDYIFGEMYKFASYNKLIRVGRDVIKLRKVIEDTSTFLTQKLGYIPSTSEIALYLEKEESEIESAINSYNQILSLDYDSELNLHEVIPDNKPDVMNKLIVDDSFKVLTDEEKEIIDYRYYKDYTQQETAKVLGISQVKVSRREKQATNKMYQYLSQ